MMQLFPLKISLIVYKTKKADRCGMLITYGRSKGEIKMKAYEETWNTNTASLEKQEEDSRLEWINRQMKGIAVFLILSQLFYIGGKGVWAQLERLWSTRIFLGVLTCDSILLIIFLGFAGVRLLLVKREDGMILRGALLCFLLLLIFGILSFLSNLLLF